MTVQEALDQRVEKIRLPHWVEGSYMSFDFFEGGVHGPWAHAKDPSGEMDILVFKLLEGTSDEWEEYNVKRD